MGLQRPRRAWQTALTQEHDLQCEAYTECQAEGARW